MTSLSLMVAEYTGGGGTDAGAQIICNGDCCNQVKLEKRLYSCLQCVDVDLCSDCYAAGTEFGQHRRNHTCERHQNWKNGVTPEVTSSENTDNTGSPSSPTSYTAGGTSPGSSLGTSNTDMDRATRTSNLLGTYLSTNQSTSVPGSSSYSTIRSGQYLDPPSYSSTRRGSNLSDDGYSRSPSRYTSTRYTGLDDDTPSSTSSYIPSYRRYRGDTTTDETPSYSSRYNSSSSSGATSTFPSIDSTPRSQRSLEIDRMSRNLERSVSSILSGDYSSRSRATTSNDDSTPTYSRPTLTRSSTLNNEPERDENGLTAEEADAAAKKIGWVDEKEAENRIGTGWWQEQQDKKNQSNSADKPGPSSSLGKKSLTDRAGSSSQTVAVDEAEPDGLTAEEIMARMNSTTVNEYGRDPDKGEVVFLAQCQCFRAELDVIKRNSSFLADIYADHVSQNGPDSFIQLEMSASVLDNLLNSFYAIKKLELTIIEWLMLLHAAQTYKCAKTRDHCIRQIRRSFENPDSTTLLVSLEIVSKYSDNTPDELDSLLATGITYLVGTNAFKKMEGIKQLYPKIYRLSESCLSNLANGVAEIANGETVVSFCMVLNLWAGEQRESSRGCQLRDILCHLQLDQRCEPKDVAKIINLSYFNENYETVHYLAMTMAKMLLQ